MTRAPTALSRASQATWAWVSATGSAASACAPKDAALLYKFDRFGYDKSENDLLWQAGLTLKI